MAWQWNFSAPWEDGQDEDFRNETLAQSEQLNNFFANNPAIPQNMAEISRRFGYLPKDVQVAGALSGLTADSPEFTAIVERFMEKESSWWESTKAATRGVVRSAVVGMESASQFVKKYGTATMKYYGKRQINPLAAFSGIGTLMPLLDPEGRDEIAQSFKDQGPTLATRAINQIREGKRVNLGEGYFGNSTVAEETDIYKELVGRGANPDQVKEIIQEYYGTPISQQEMSSREGNSGTYRGRKGVVKLSPGRVAAVEVFEPGTRSFNLMSGIIDAAYTVFTDPANYAGMGFAKAGKAAKSFNQTAAKADAGLLDKVVRKTVKVPTAKQYFLESKTGDDIAQLFADAKTYDEVEILLGRQGKLATEKSAGGARLYKRLRDTDNKDAIKNILINAVEDPLTNVSQRLDPNSLLFKGSLSKTAAKFMYGDKQAAVGLRTNMKLNGSNNLFSRLFSEFPAPKINTDDLNETFFQLKGFMKFAKVDDDVATKALDRVVDAMEDETLQLLDGMPASLQKLNMMLDIYSGETGVLRHIQEKFGALGLPREVVNQIGKFTASIDEANKYFYGTYGEEAWNLQKLDIMDKGLNSLDSIEFNMAETIDLLDTILTNTSFKKTKTIRKFEDLKQDFLANAESAARVPTDLAEGQILPRKIITGGGPGSEQEALKIAKELDIETGGTGTPGFNHVAAEDAGRFDKDAGKLNEFGLTDDSARQVDFIDKQIEAKEKAAMFKNNSKVTTRKLLTQIKEQKKVAEYKVIGIDKGIKNAQISPVATEEQILVRIQNARNVEANLQKLRVQLEGKTTRGVTQEGKRIKETSVQVSQTQKDIIINEFNFDAQTRILRYARGLKNDPDKGIMYEDFDMIGYQKELKALAKERDVLNKNLQKLKANESQRLAEINDDSIVKQLDNLQKEKVKLQNNDYSTKPLPGKYYVNRAKKNVDDADMTVVVYNSKSAPLGKGSIGTINYATSSKWSSGKPSLIRGSNVKGNKPIVVIDAAEELTFAEIQKVQALIKKYPIVNVAGPRTFTDSEAMNPLLKTLFVQKEDAFDTKSGFKVYKNAKVSPNQVLNYFENLTNDAEFLEEVTGQLMKKANFNEVEAVVGRPTAHLISEYLASGSLPLPDARLFLRVYAPAREFWARLVPGVVKPRNGSIKKVLTKTQLRKALEKVELDAKQYSVEGQTHSVISTLLGKELDKLGFTDADPLTRKQLNNFAEQIDFINLDDFEDFVMVDAESGIGTLGNIDKLLKGMDEFLNVPIDEVKGVKGANIGDNREFVVSEFEEFLSKPVKELYDLQMADDKTIFQHAKLMVKTSRKKFNLSKDEESVRELTQGWLSLLGDSYMNKAWKPFILIRGAWTARVVGEEQIRMWAADLDNVFTHPISAFAWIMGKNRKQVLNELGDVENLNVDALIAKGQFGIRDNGVLGQALEHQASMSKSHGGILDTDKLKRTWAMKQVKYGEDGFTGSAVSEIYQMVDDPIAQQLAAIKGGIDDPAFRAGLQDVKDRFWDGDLSDWRNALAYGSDEAGKYQKIKILNDRQWADDYIDSVYARVHYKTGGAYKVYEILPDGTKRLFDDVIGQTRTRKSAQSRIEFELTETGNSELLEHIAKGAELDRVTQQGGRPVYLQIGDEQITFGRNGTIGDKKKYQAYLGRLDNKQQIYKPHHTMKKSVYDLDGERINSYDAAIERLFSIVMSAPTNRLSRSPAFRQFYWRFIEENMAYFDDGLRKQIKKQAQRSKLDKSFMKKLEKTGKVTADEGKLLNIDSLDELDNVAKAYAMTETKGLLYDLNKRHVVSDMLRLAFPFAEVYIEILGTWSRLLNKKKFLMTRKMSRGIEGGRKLSLDDDDEGFFHTDDMTGEEMFFFPGSEMLSNYMFDGNKDSRTVTNPVTGEVIEAPDAKVNLKGYVSSLNMIAGNPAPGLGPLVGIPASKLLPKTDLIDKVFFPYGREEDSPLNPYTFADALVPSWLKKALSIGSNNTELNRTYANTYKDVIKMFVTTGLYDDSTPAKAKIAMEKAESTATTLTLIRSLIQFAAPTGAVLRYEVEVAPGGAIHIDPAKTKDEDPKHHFYGISVLSDAYYRILAKYRGDQIKATTEFVNQFGLDPTALLVSKSKEIKKRSYTDEGTRFYQDNEEFMDTYPDVGYFLFPDNPLDEFNFVAWADSFAERDRVDLSEDEYITAVRQSQGRLAYEYQRRLLFDSGIHNNISGERKYQILTELRNALRVEYPGYGTVSTAAKSIDSDAKLRQLEYMIENEGNQTINLPNGETTLLKDLPTMQGLSVYLEERNKILSIIKQKDGIRATLRRDEYSYFRNSLRQLAQQLFSEYPDFYYVYDDILRYEVEEEFSDVFTSGEGY